jgi:2-aminoadipate transaminase
MLPEAEWVKPEGGFFIGVTLPEGLRASDVRQKALSEGVRLSDGAGFYPDGNGSRFVRIPFCGVSEEEIETAITAFSKAVHSIMKSSRRYENAEIGKQGCPAC